MEFSEEELGEMSRTAFAKAYFGFPPDELWLRVGRELKVILDEKLEEHKRELNIVHKGWCDLIHREGACNCDGS